MNKDAEAQKYAPKVLRKASQGTRPYSTSAPLRQQQLQSQQSAQNDASVAQVASMLEAANIDAGITPPGLKFHMPAPLPKTENVKMRYDPMVDQFTKLLMQDGKLSMAQKVYTEN